ncbi:MAG: VOC family protein [Pseudomonadota bacterium]
MKIKRIEHVGVVVKDIEASRELWENIFGIPLGGMEENERRKLALYYVGDSMVELISGKGPDNKHMKLIAEGRGGINHLCFEVELKSKGVPLLDEIPRIGHAGARVAFLDPKGTEGCLIELAELPAEAQPH